MLPFTKIMWSAFLDYVQKSNFAATYISPMKLLFSFTILILAHTALKAQHGSIQAQETIEKFFKGLNSQDTALISTTLFEEVELATVVYGSKPVKVESVEHFLKGVYRSRGMDLEERITSYEILLDEGMAIVWAPYRFYVNGQLSHCGVNAFTLILTDKGWRILSIIDTRRKENCHPEEQD